MEERNGRQEEVVIHTDGGCRGNPGPGSYAAILQYGTKRRELVGTEQHTTNNRMELRAAIVALEALKRPCRVRLVTDSEYLRLGITQWLPNWIKKRWKTSSRKPVQNRDLWERLEELSRVHQVEWDWVPSHSGHPENERCDQLVNEAMDRMGA